MNRGQPADGAALGTRSGGLGCQGCRAADHRARGEFSPLPVLPSRAHSAAPLITSQVGKQGAEPL